MRFIFRLAMRRKPPLVTRLVPYMIEFSDKHNLTLDHVRSMCTTMMETEAATVAVQMVLVLIRLAKRRTF